MVSKPPLNKPCSLGNLLGNSRKAQKSGCDRQIAIPGSWSNIPSRETTPTSDGANPVWESPPASLYGFDDAADRLHASAKRSVEVLCPEPLRTWRSPPLKSSGEVVRSFVDEEEIVYDTELASLTARRAMAAQPGKQADMKEIGDKAGETQMRKDSQLEDSKSSNGKDSATYLDQLLEEIDAALKKALNDIRGLSTSEASTSFPLQPELERDRFSYESELEILLTGQQAVEQAHIDCEFDSFIRRGLDTKDHMYQPEYSIARAAAEERQRKDGIRAIMNLPRPASAYGSLTALPSFPMPSATNELPKLEPNGPLVKRRSMFGFLNSQPEKEAPAKKIAEPAPVSTEEGAEAPRKLRKRGSVYDLFRAAATIQEEPVDVKLTQPPMAVKTQASVDVGEASEHSELGPPKSNTTLKKRKSLLRPLSWFVKIEAE